MNRATKKFSTFYDVYKVEKPQNGEPSMRKLNSNFSMPMLRETYFHLIIFFQFLLNYHYLQNL